MSLPFALEPWHWLALGVALAGLEILLPGAVLIWFGAAAFCVGGLLWLLPDLSSAAQFGSFAVLAPLCLGLGLWLRKRGAAANPEAVVNQGAARLIGQRGRLEGALENGHGEMRLGDTVWPVRGPDLPAGSIVQVIGAEGALLLVTPAPPA
ncbi:NfeD family protein [Ferrovibrio sp.]|uniref:NfeD family protein n=1 Tax=Ferrovibrio sp. TaxID=1917215 RepID=UPI001B3DC197|nr:NfeD family protein [Ferrovibrio sp.]MBP7062848.1 NfeD family protein [Ferrovibrio sp.]